MKQSKSTKFATKDFIVIGVLSAVFFVVYMIISMLTAMINPIAHVFSPAVGGVTCGIIYLLMISKSPKKGVFTISSIVVMLLFQLLRNGYLPWVISVIVSAIVADLICIPSGYKNFKAIAASYGTIMVGQAFGNVMPVVFFAEKFKKDFLSRGVDPLFMDTMINFIKGPIAIVIMIVSFLAGIIGMLIAKKLLNKHFKKAGIV